MTTERERNDMNGTAQRVKGEMDTTKLRVRGNMRDLKNQVKGMLSGNPCPGDVSLTAIYLRRVATEYELTGRLVPVRIAYTLAQFERFLGYRVH